jgi:serine kinase of HPr protein (carbohydrate metabolism regulator)
MDINAEQKRIAFQDPKGHALLKGVAGSGKTCVGICRIPFLLQNHCFAKDDAILVATYNRTLVGYMAHLYEKMDCKAFAAFNSLFAATDDKLDTLKRFTRMGENVILLSENPAYDPIMLSEGQVSILGITVGVLKNG